MALSHTVSEWQSDKCRGVGNFASFLPLNWLPWQRPLRYRKIKVGLIICHSISTIWCKDCENRSSGSWDTSAPSERVQYETKLVVIATSLEILKKISDPSSAPKRLSYGLKIAKIACRLCFAYDTKLVAMATSLEELEKWTWSRKFTQISSIWWKDRENRSSRYWDSFAPSKKKKKLRKVKYIARSASLPSGLNNNNKKCVAKLSV